MLVGRTINQPLLRDEGVCVCVKEEQELNSLKTNSPVVVVGGGWLLV